MPDLHLTTTYSLFFIIIAGVLAGILAVYGYRYTLPPVSQFLRISLLMLRGLGLFLLVLLLGEPLLSLIAHRSEKPVLAVLIDQSKSLTIRDKSGDRKETMLKVLHAPAFDEVRKTSDIVYAVFDSKTRVLQSLSDDSISFRGEETDMGGALRVIRTESRQLNLGAVLILSDGNATSGSSPMFEAEESGLPVSTVGIGDTSVPQDIQVQRTSAMGISYVGTKIPVDVTLRSSGVANERVEVSLLEGGSVRDRKTIVLEPGIRQYEVSLAFLPEAEGMKKITVEVSQLPGEISTQNNRSSFYVKVLKSKMRVVVFASAPSPDLSAFRQAMQADANVDLKVFVERGGGQFYEGAPTPQDFRDADCLVLIGFPGTASASSVLREIIDQGAAGKGIFFMMSRTVDLKRLGMLQPSLPFIPPQRQGEEAQTFFAVSESQRNNAVMRTLPAQDVWSRLPPVFILDEALQSKPESEVLASGRTQMIPANIPLLLSRKVNRAKSLALTCYGVWRWKTYAEGIPGAEKLLEDLFSNSIRWLVTREDERPVRIRPTKEIYSGSEPVEFTAQVYDDNYAPIDDAEVSVLVSRKGETSQLTLTPLRNGRLEGSFEPLPEGDYTYTARAMVGATELAREGGSFTVGGLNAEFLETRMNKSLLQQLAARTGGTYYDPAELSRLPADLAALQGFQTRDVSTARSFELWNKQWVLALLVVLFSVEWFLRKRNGMM